MKTVLTNIAKDGVCFNPLKIKEKLAEEEPFKRLIKKVLYVKILSSELGCFGAGDKICCQSKIKIT